MRENDLMIIERCIENKNEKLDVKEEPFEKLMFFYKSALKQLELQMNIIKDEFKLIYNYDLIDHIDTRIKEPKSIVKKMEKKKLILGVIGADVHAVGNAILNRAFLDAGFDVTNLGVLVPQDEFIKAAVEVGADAIIVSSLYGQGEIDCTGMREKCDEAGLKGILLYAGGNLVVGKVPVEEIERRYKAMGFDRAFGPGTDPQVTIDCLKKDLGIE